MYITIIVINVIVFIIYHILSENVCTRDVGDGMETRFVAKHK